MNYLMVLLFIMVPVTCVVGKVIFNSERSQWFR